MPAFRLNAFLGEVPRLSTRLLANNNAQSSYNAKLTSGRIKPWFYPLDVSANIPSGTIQTVYRMYSGATDYWIGWTDEVDVAKGPVVGDTTFRIYFGSDAFEPRVTNLALATASTPYPNSWYVLGVTPPTTAPSCTPSGGSGSQETRAYVYTFVTQWGEESAPSPASTAATGYVNGTWAVTMADVAPPNSYTISAAVWSGGTLTLTVNSTFGLRAGEYVTLSGLAPAALNASWEVATVASSTSLTITMADPGTITDQIGSAARDAPHNTTSMMKRLYRAVTGSSTTTYYYVKEVAVATTSTNDDAGSAIGEALLTTDWDMPPVDLRGLITHPSGALVGFRSNELWFSEPTVPYAWNQDYRVTTDFDIVAIGLFGSTIVVTTEGSPYIVSGVDPSAMSPTKVDKPWPCLSKRSLVSMGDSVIWACPLGLAVIGSDGAQLATEQFFTVDEWRELEPDTMISGYYDSKYFAAYTTADGMELLVFDRTREATITRGDFTLNAIYSDAATGYLYVVVDAALKRWDADTSYRLPFTWWSKEFVLPVPVNVGAAKVEADFGVTDAEATASLAAQAAQVAINAGYISGGTLKGAANTVSYNTYSLNGSKVLEPSLVATVGARSVIFELLDEDGVVYSKTVSSNSAFRLPSGTKYDKFSIRLIGDAIVDSVVLGETMDSLRTA